MASRSATKPRPAPLKVDTERLSRVTSPPGSSRFHEDFDAPFSESLVGPDTSAPAPVDTTSSRSRRSLSTYGPSELSPTSFTSSWSSSTSWRRSSPGDKLREWIRLPVRKLRGRGSGKVSHSASSSFGGSRSSIWNRHSVDVNLPADDSRATATAIPEAWWKLSP